MNVTIEPNDSLFVKVIVRGNICLKVIGLQIDMRDGNRNFMEILRRRRFFTFMFLCMIIDVTGQSAWLIQSYLYGDSDLINITFVMPCLTFTAMAFIKSYYFLKNIHYIHDVMSILKKLKMFNIKTKREKNFVSQSINFLKAANKIIILANSLTIIAFGVGPLIKTIANYYINGEIKLYFPFIFSYPFNAFDIRIWPCLYIQQLWSAIITVSAIWGPDYVAYALITFTIIQFYLLKEKIENLIHKPRTGERFIMNKWYRVQFKEMINVHNDLMRCAELLETSYTKSILLNVISSSLLICFNLFNIMTNNNMLMKASFTAFLSIVMWQIFLLCYFGDVLKRSSAEISDAIYNCLWYYADPAVVKDLTFISLRTNKPCKLTAFGYSEVNLKTFTKILSTSWSYFALLQTVYNNNKVAENTRL